ncbi:MAG: M56 family metallopeptidase [Alphaproteobacteria bacterium]|nr:M56 family metallopeptidase [Alphaproteobacteria bacterium]
MSELFVLRALVFAGGCFAASSLVFALAWCATRFVRRAGLRHALWFAAFGAALLVPAAALMAPPGVVFERRVAAEQAPPIYVEVAQVPAVHEAGVQKISGAPTPSWPGMPNMETRDIAVALLIAWSLGALWVLSRLALGGIALSALRRNSKPHALASSDLPRLDTRGRECELRLAAGEDGPITWGVFKPVILLPHSAARWPRARLQAVLLHELAHVRRRDGLTQLLAFVVCALLWPNPLAWLAARSLRREAEIAADDQVIVSGVRPSAYAGELLGLASEFRGRRGLAVAMAGQSALEARVKSALAPNPSRSGVSPMDIFKVVSLGVAVTALLAFARPDVVDAKDGPQRVVDMSSPAPMTAPTPMTAPPPMAAPTPAAAPTPETDPTPAVDPAAPAEPVVIDDEGPSDGNIVVRETRDRHGRKVRVVHMGHIDHAQIQAAVEQAHRAEAEIARIQPQIDRAIAAAKIDEKTARAIAKVEPQIRAEVARAIAKVQPAIHQAMVQVRISQKAIEAAARAHAHMIRMERHVDNAMEHDDEAGADADDDSAAGNEADDDHDADENGDESEPEDSPEHASAHE